MTCRRQAGSVTNIFFQIGQVLTFDIMMVVDGYSYKNILISFNYKREITILA